MKRIDAFMLIIVILAAATACDTKFDYHLSRSIFIPDQDNPGLPIYSEKGYNSFGVYWGLKPFTSQSNEESSQVIVRGDSCHINFYGLADSSTRMVATRTSDSDIHQAGLFYYGETGYAAHTLTFTIPDFKPNAFGDLLSLNNKKYNLKEDKCVVSLMAGSDSLHVEILEGEFYIKKAQNLYVDNVLTRVVLSGTFSFKALLNDMPTSFLNGRFDMGYGDENFFLLQKKTP